MFFLPFEQAEGRQAHLFRYVEYTKSYRVTDGHTVCLSVYRWAHGVLVCIQMGTRLPVYSQPIHLVYHSYLHVDHLNTN